MSRTASSYSYCSLVCAALAGTILAPCGNPAWADQILEFYAPTSTTYLPTSNTNVQDVRPLAAQRGVNLDGSLRAGASLPMALAGNPTEPGAGGSSLSGVRLDTGTYAITDVDLALPATGFSWVIGRSYNCRQKDSGGSYIVSDGFQGKCWFQLSEMEIVLYDAGNGQEDKDVVYLVYGADRYIEFKRQSKASNQFKAKNGAAGVIDYAAGASTEPDTYTYTDQAGNKFVFFGWGDPDVDDDIEGMLWKMTDPAGNVAYVGDATTGSTALSSGYDATIGAITKAYDTSDRRYTYTYTSSRLTQVKAETRTGGTWASPTGLAEVGKVDYSYYVDADPDGQAGDLKLVTITTPLTDSSMWLVQKKLYRYYEGSYDATSNPGYEHQIKMIVSSEGYRKYDWLDSDVTDDDPISAAEADLKPYASAYFKYDTSRRIINAWFNGACGCSGGSGTGTTTFEYETNSQYSDDTAAYDNAESEWYSRTTVFKPDGSYLTAYFDEMGQPLHRVITAADPDTNPGSKWVTRVIRNSDGQVTDINSPANVTAYTHTIGVSWGFTTSSSVGLATTFNRETSGDMKGFVLDVKHKTGTSGSAYLDRTLTYTSSTKTVTDVIVTRPFVASSRVYSTEVTSGTSGSYLTSMAYTFYTSDAVLMPKKIITTYPAVSTGNNGSNSSTTSTVYLRKDGTTAFTESPDGIFNYTKFTNGQLVKQIVDAQTNHGSDFASGDDPNTDFSITETSSGLRHITEHAYDAQGRRDLSTLHSETANDKRYLKSYYSRLKDHRLVTLAFNDYEATPKFYGPVSYSVTNQAGRSEAQATIKLTNNESTTALTSWIDEADADPITSVDVGTVARLATSIYDETGMQLEESRPYFLIPGSGAGSAGTNYDPTKYGYDDAGRQRRVKDATGTISRTTYDSIGRSGAQYIGTNDNGDAGGESSGSNNMVKVSEVEFDSAGVGNSFVTKRTAFIQSSTTGKRETTFSYDVRGRALLQTNPTAPHVFNKFDNMGRLIASGQFSSTGSIVVGTDDPTTETTNRMALSQTFFDEMGRVWKSQRHKIDDADGSDDDTLLTLTWYDAAGRVIKVDGEQLTKTAYDRIGRATSQFILASDDDAAFSDTDDVTGDIVLQQSITMYDPNDGNVIATAVIDRFHDDLSTGNTGALDTNGDADDLMFTAANIRGRIQITATWYDRFDRVTDTARYGNNNGSDFDRDGLAVPSRSDTVLVTSTTYNTDGSVKETTDPRALVTRIEYDDLGRQVDVIANYVNGTPSGSTGDDDVFTRFVYVNGLRTMMWVDFDGDNVVDTSAPKDQVTEYTYGITTADSPGASLFASNRLLRKVTYPDSGSSDDVVRFAYNAQGQQIWTQDQAGNVIQTDFDDSGRVTHKRATTIAGSFDDAVKRISTTYDSLGRRSLVTQYDNATVGSGSVLDEVKFTYEDWGMLGQLQENHGYAVGGGGIDYSVSYTYAKATTGRNTIRRTTMSLPGSNSVLNYTYSSAGNFLDDAASRVTTVEMSIGPVTLAEYRYNGVSQVVGTNLPEPDVMWNKYTTSGVYPDLDRFNRVTSSRWTRDLATDRDFYSLDVVYDRDSNITRTKDNVYNAGQDVVFTMDNLNRLTDAQRGTWNGSTITSEVRQETWTLDQVGNWDRDKLDLENDNDYNGTGEFNDKRTHNVVNELTGRDTDDSGTDNYTLTYDDDGNLTDDGAQYKNVWDPFGRLRKVKNQSNTVIAEFRYNGLGWRITMLEDTDLDGDADGSDKTVHLVYDETWRIVATFRETDAYPKERFVYHAPGLGGFGASDNLILRDKDANTAWITTSDGTLEQRRYYTHNWRGDAATIFTDLGAPVETVRYDAYGECTGVPWGDADGAGVTNNTDATQVQTWIDGPTYDVRGDVDGDGDVDSADKAIVVAASGTNLGRGALSIVGSRRGYGAYERDVNLAVLYHVRNRVYNTTLGRWTRRDPAEFVDGPNFYQYSAGRPLVGIDPMGTFTYLRLLSLPASTSQQNRYSGCGSIMCSANLVGLAPTYPCPANKDLVIIAAISISAACQCGFGDLAWDNFLERWGKMTMASWPNVSFQPHRFRFSGRANCEGQFNAKTTEIRGYCLTQQEQQTLDSAMTESAPVMDPVTGLTLAYQRTFQGTCCGRTISSYTNQTASSLALWGTPPDAFSINQHRCHSQWFCCGCGVAQGTCDTTVGYSCSPGPDPRCDSAPPAP